MRLVLRLAVVGLSLAFLAVGCKGNEEALKKQADEFAKASQEAAKAQAALKADAEKAKADAAKAVGDVTTARAEIEKLKGEADAAKAEAAKLKTDLDAAKAEADKAKADLAAELEKVKAAAQAKLDAAKAAALEVVAAQYAAIDKGDVDGYGATIDPAAFYFGSSSLEAIQGRDGMLAILHQVFDPAVKTGGKFATRVTNLQTGIYPDGKALWIADEVEITITIGDKPMVLPFRVTQLLVDKDGKWTVIALAWSHSMPNEEAFKAAAEGKLPVPAAIADLVDAGAEPLAQAYSDTVADVAKMLATVSDRDDAFVFGTAAEEKVTGGKTIKEAFGAQVQQFGVTTAKKDGIRVGLAPNGKVGFVAGNIDYTATIEGNKITVPYRYLGIYRDEEGAWKSVQVHFSIGIAAQQ
jgi:hypothetical protein